MSQNITGIKIVQDNIVKITFQLTNTELETGFNWREIGIIAEDPDTQAEVLFVYGNAGDNGEYIAPGGETDILEKYINIDLIVSNTENISAIIDKSLIFVSQKEFEELKKKEIIISEEEPEAEECIWYQIINSQPIPSQDVAEIILEVANEYDENSKYQLETITNMTDNENDQTKIIEKEE